MFQQFKNIFPTGTLNLRSLSESVGINDSEWSRGVERIGALRNEFQQLNSVFLSREGSSDTLSSMHSSRQEIPSITELEATGQMINSLQDSWNEIHNNNIKNIENAKLADTKLNQLQDLSERHFKVCEMLENSEDDIKVINENLDSIQSLALNLMDVLSTLEEKIDKVSVDYEKNELQKWKESQENEILNYAAEKRQLLREREIKLREEYEQHEQIQIQKRVELYEANFNADLEDYRRRRETEIASLYSNYNSGSADENSISNKLNEVKLTDDSEKLDDFLGGEENTNALVLQLPEEEEVEEQTLEKSKKKKSKSKSKTKTKKPQYKSFTSSDDDSDGGQKIEILADEDYEDL